MCSWPQERFRVQLTDRPGDSGVPGTSDVVDARSHIMDALSNRRSRARRRSCLRLGALLRTTAAGAFEPRAREEIRV
ncbi:hypothetical protein HPB47_002044, partial [Ixodes persulcatus]